MQCTLQEVATHLPLLKKVVTVTNKTHGQYLQEQTTEREGREDVWKVERKSVDDMARSLRFD